MKALYLDCFSGISGDMMLGALLDLGIDKDVFLNEIRKLNLEGYDIRINRIQKSGITGTDVSVLLHQYEHGHNHHHMHAHSNGNEHEHEHGHEHACEHDHGHEHGHGHGHLHTHHHGHDHSYEHAHGHDHGYGHGDDDMHTHAHEHKHGERNLVDIENIINASGLSERVKNTSITIFREIAQAEAKVHGRDILDVHFHEVGAVDSIVDIVGVSICLDILNIERIYSSEIHDGKGFIECQHGIIPVPVPAVMQMLSGSGIPLVQEDIPTELVTPTGMAIVKCCSSGFGKMPVMEIDKVGYGFGKRNIGRLNALRVIMGNVGEKSELGSVNNRNESMIIVLETNIDDMNPEIFGFVMDKLFDAGALDVFYIPVYMKKNRPGILMTVLARPDNEQKIVDIIFRETTTIGIRKNMASRYEMERKKIKVNTPYGEISVKIAAWGNIKKAAPEYNDCRELAVLTGQPLNVIYNAAIQAAEGKF